MSNPLRRQEVSSWASLERTYVMVAPNGARLDRLGHPQLPVSVDQIVEVARTCFDAGAQGLHLHVRDDQGQHSLDAGRYRETIAALHSIVPDMDVQIPTEAAGVFDVKAQLDCLLEVQPTWASISVREIARARQLAERVYGLCKEQGTRVQHILYDAEDAKLLEHWKANKIVRAGQADRLFVLGRYATAQVSALEDIDLFPLDAAPWMVCAFGSQEHICLQEAALRGGDVRVGFENSLTDPTGRPWSDNAESVAALISRIERTSK